MAFGLAPLGFSPEGEIGITDEEADVLASLGSLGDASGLFSEAEVLSLFRVLGSSLGRMADATLSLFLTDVESPAPAVRRRRAAADEEGVRGGADARRVHPRRSTRCSAGCCCSRSSVPAGPRSVHASACSIGMRSGSSISSGFTEISGSMSTTELSTFLRDFEGRAYDVVNEAGARVVKLIGDEVMFVATNADAACRAAEALMAGFGSDGDGWSGRCCPRGGIAYGEVLVRGGDYYGSVVNLASRLADQAVPQELLVTEELAEARRALYVRAGGPAGR